MKCRIVFECIARRAITFAQKLISSDGKTDGLYWSPDLGEG
ncbi:DUF2950 family protein, partial [Rhizobium johnstonii]